MNNKPTYTKLPLLSNPDTLEAIIQQRRTEREQRRKESKERTEVFLTSYLSIRKVKNKVSIGD